MGNLKVLLEYNAQCTIYCVYEVRMVYYTIVQLQLMLLYPIQ